MVHLNVAEVPATNPVMLVVGELIAVIETLPETRDHTPTPVPKSFPAKEVVLELHKF